MHVLSKGGTRVMYFDALCAAAVSDELRARLLGGFVQKVVLPSKDAIALEVYAGHERHPLLLSTDPTQSRAMLLSGKPTATPGLVTPLGLLLRKHVLDGVVEEIEQPAGERVISLSIAKRAGGLNQKVWLSAELMGRHANLLLLDGERTTILESVKRVTSEMSSVRPVLPKRAYTPPPPRPGLQPHRVTPGALEEASAQAKGSSFLWQLLVSQVSGMSPLSGREVTYRATGDAEARVGSVQDWAGLAVQLRRLASLWATREWRPCIAVSDEAVVAYAPYELTHLASDAELSFPASMSEAIESYSGASARIVSHAQLRERVLGALDKRADQVARRLRSIAAQEEGAHDAERLMEDGQMILAYAYQIEPGQEELRLPDRTVPLDPSLSASENAQEKFEEYRRRQRATSDLPAVRAQAESELATIEEYRTFAMLAKGHTELSQLQAEALAEGVLRESGDGAKRQRKPPAGKLSSFTAPDGTHVLVGRSAAQNRQALETGAPHDWWFHAREIPGGHVVARTGGREPSEETLRLAAETAAYHSAAREDTSVEIVYTPLRNVRKIKGAGPGQVTYRNERAIRVAPRDHLGDR